MKKRLNEDEQIENLIKQLASQMPVVMEQTHEVHHIYGSELIAQGHYELDNGKKVVAGVKYKQNFPVMMAINHERRMRRAYKKDGRTGLLNYVTLVKNMAIQNKQS